MTHDRTNACEKCGQPHPRCRAHNTTGNPCGVRPVTGLDVCQTHGGRAPRAKAKSAQVTEEAAAARELARFGQAVTTHPAEALLDLVNWTAGEVAYWRDVVTQLEADGSHKALTWGVVKTEKGRDRGEKTNITTEQAGVHIAYQMLERASDRLASYATAALRAGVDERRVQLAERQGHLVASTIRRILDRLNLDEKQKALVGTVVPEELRLLAPSKETA